MRTNEITERLGQAIRKRRELLGLTQKDLALLAGCSPVTLWNIEIGKPSTRFENILSVCQAVGIQLRAETGNRGIAIEPYLEGPNRETHAAS